MGVEGTVKVLKASLIERVGVEAKERELADAKASEKDAEMEHARRATEKQRLSERSVAQARIQGSPARKRR
jgi:hypothetical protein